LLQKQKIFVQVESLPRRTAVVENKANTLKKIEKMYDNAMGEYKAGKTIY